MGLPDSYGAGSRSVPAVLTQVTDSVSWYSPPPSWQVEQERRQHKRKAPRVGEVRPLLCLSCQGEVLALARSHAMK